jgi:hypothetical protein
MSRSSYSQVIGLVFLALVVAPRTAHAQSPPPSHLALTTGIAMTSQWDDETHLGRGVLLSLGVGSVLRDRLRLEAEVSLARHHRNAGTLETTGTPVVGTARAAWLFGSSRSRARPFVSAGVMLTHSRGDWVQTPLVSGPGGAPVVGTVEQREWRFTKPGFETGLGVEIRGRGRMWWRPEVRFSGTTGYDTYQPGVNTLEIPLIAVRGGVTVLW